MRRRSLAASPSPDGAGEAEAGDGALVFIGETIAIATVLGVLALHYMFARLDAYGREHPGAGELLEAAYKETTILGLTAFALFVTERAGAGGQAGQLDETVLHELESIHIGVWTLTLIYLAWILLLLGLSRHVGQRWKRIERRYTTATAAAVEGGQGTTAHLEQREAHRQLKMDLQAAAHQLQLPLDAPLPLPGTLRARVRPATEAPRRTATICHLLCHPLLSIRYIGLLQNARFLEQRARFIARNRLPSDFAFTAYLRQCKTHVLVKLAQIRIELWMFMIGVISLDVYLRSEWLWYRSTVDGTVLIVLASLAGVLLSIAVWAKMRAINWKLFHPQGYGLGRQEDPDRGRPSAARATSTGGGVSWVSMEGAGVPGGGRSAAEGEEGGPEADALPSLLPSRRSVGGARPLSATIEEGDEEQEQEEEGEQEGEQEGGGLTSPRKTVAEGEAPEHLNMIVGRGDSIVLRAQALENRAEQEQGPASSHIADGHGAPTAATAAARGAQRQRATSTHARTPEAVETQRALFWLGEPLLLLRLLQVVLFLFALGVTLLTLLWSDATESTADFVASFVALGVGMLICATLLGEVVPLYILSIHAGSDLVDTRLLARAVLKHERAKRARAELKRKRIQRLGSDALMLPGVRAQLDAAAVVSASFPPMPAVHHPYPYPSQPPGQGLATDTGTGAQTPSTHARGPSLALLAGVGRSAVHLVQVQVSCVRYTWLRTWRVAQGKDESVNRATALHALQRLDVQTFMALIILAVFFLLSITSSTWIVQPYRRGVFIASVALCACVVAELCTRVALAGPKSWCAHRRQAYSREHASTARLPPAQSAWLYLWSWESCDILGVCLLIAAVAVAWSLAGPLPPSSEGQEEGPQPVSNAGAPLYVAAALLLRCARLLSQYRTGSGGKPGSGATPTSGPGPGGMAPARRADAPAEDPGTAEGEQGIAAQPDDPMLLPAKPPAEEQVVLSMLHQGQGQGGGGGQGAGQGSDEAEATPAPVQRQTSIGIRRSSTTIRVPGEHVGPATALEMIERQLTRARALPRGASVRSEHGSGSVSRAGSSEGTFGDEEGGESVRVYTPVSPSPPASLAPSSREQLHLGQQGGRQGVRRTTTAGRAVQGQGGPPLIRASLSQRIPRHTAGLSTLWLNTGEAAAGVTPVVGAPGPGPATRTSSLASARRQASTMHDVLLLGFQPRAAGQPPARH